MSTDMSKPQSPFQPMFEQFRTELDEHHDRRERVIKASRDITAASKKIIFSLQRIRDLRKPIPPFIHKANKHYWETIETQYKTIARDVQGINAYRYRSITGGNQEFIEAATFQHYLETQTLMPYDGAKSQITDLCGEGGEVMLTIDDYVLGIFDMTGELMRFAITAMATNGQLPSGDSQPESIPKRSSTKTASDVQSRTVLTDLRELRTVLEKLEVPYHMHFGRDIGKKMGVMQTSVEKVENALYGLVVRGSERPKGWMPDLNQSSGHEGIEGY